MISQNMHWVQIPNYEWKLRKKVVNTHKKNSGSGVRTNTEERENDSI